MATATSSALPLNPVTGRSVVTLTSYSGQITWTTTPISGDQIEYPDQLTVTAAGVISGPAGTYTLRHIIATTGAIQAFSFVISAQTSASSVVALTPAINGDFDYVTLTSYSGPMTFAVTPVAGDQIVFPSTVTVGADGSFSGANTSYTIWHVRQNGVVEAITYVHSGANTAPQFGVIADVVANQTDAANFSIAATDPDTGDSLTYSHDVLPNGITRTTDTISGTYNNEETVLTTFTVQDDSGDTGNDSDTAQVLFSIARAGYTITSLTVNYANLNPDSPLIAAITDGDLTVGDQVDYPTSATDAIGTSRTIGFASDGLMSATGTRSIVVPGIYIRDSSNAYARTGPFQVTLVGTGPALTSPLEVVPNSPTTSGGQMRFTADESGNYRLIVIPSGFGTPTRDQVMAGAGPDGNIPLFDSGLTAQTATVEEVVTVTGLPIQGAGYWVFLALEDALTGVTLEGPVTLATKTSGQPPSWSAIPLQNWSEGTAVNLDFRAFCTDAVTFSIAGLPAGTGLSLNPSTGVLSGSPNLFDAAGAPGTTTSYTFNVSATNATGTTQTTFDADVYRLNPPATISQIVSQSWKEGVNFSLVLSAFISGATSYQIEYDDNGTFTDAEPTFTAYGLSFVSANGVLSGTPNSTMPPDSPIVYRARAVNADGNGDWLQFTATIDALAPPTFNGPIPAQNFTQGTSVSVNFASYFANETSITTVLPSGSGLSLSSAGLLTGTPNASDVAASPYVLTLTASNADGNVTGTVSITVSASIVPILIAGFPDFSYNIGGAVSINFTNYIQNATSYTVAGLPVGTGIIQQTNGLGGTWNQSDSDAAPFVVTVTGTNSQGSVSDTFLINTLAAPSEILDIYDPIAQFDKFWGDPYRVKVKDGASNWTQITLYNDGEPHILNNYTELKVSLSDGVNTYEADSANDPLIFDASPGGGKFNVRLGKVSAPAGNYYLDVYYKDLTHPDYVMFTADRSLIVEVR